MFFILYKTLLIVVASQRRCMILRPRAHHRSSLLFVDGRTLCSNFFSTASSVTVVFFFSLNASIGVTESAESTVWALCFHRLRQRIHDTASSCLCLLAQHTTILCRTWSFDLSIATHKLHNSAFLVGPGLQSNQVIALRRREPLE